MLWVEVEENLTALAAGLAQVLAEPSGDPMAPEWIVVPSAGIDRWLRLQLAQHLGASGAATGDGIAANLQVLYPGRFTRLVLADHPQQVDADPWDVEHLTWVILQVLVAHADDPELARVARVPEGATLWGRCRRLADQFDRYVTHRPQMVAAWEAGRSVDPWGAPLPVRATWQAHLWRLVVDRAGQVSPAQARLDRIQALRQGGCPAEVPSRVFLFGLTSIPGGAPFVQLLDALAPHREVHLYLPQPSLAMARATLAGSAAAEQAVQRRAEEAPAGQAAHPLLRSWARSSRETVQLLGPRAADALERDRPDPGGAPATLLGRLQADLRADRRPEPTFSPDPEDRSVLIHSCHGTTRQVEVLRDQILHLLALDPTLSEDDIVVMSPALETFAPLIEAVWGPSADERSGPVGSGAGAPALRYRITDRSLGSSVPMVAALGALIDLLDSRFSGAAVLEFANLAPVRERYGLEDADLDLFATWVDEANVRWGLSGPHRERWGVPPQYAAGTWRHALDRILLGVMLTDDTTTSGVGGNVPIDVEGQGVGAAGRLADLVDRLATLSEQARTPRSVADWITLLQGAAGQLFAPPRTAQWQQAQLDGMLRDIAEAAAATSTASDDDAIILTLADVRAMIGRGMRRTAGRADFFRGGVTVSSLTPLRGVPHKVVCLLGLDETAFTTQAHDGDDLIAASPAVGDLDRRAEARQAVLDAVLAAGSHLVVTHTGHSIVTSQPVPRAVVLAELVDVLTATLEPGDDALLAGFMPVQPCQSYDQRNFVPDGIGRAADTGAPWSFDPIALTGAVARSSPGVDTSSFLVEPLPSDLPETIEVAQLRDFLVHPVRHFLARRLGITLPDPAQRSGDLKVSTALESGGGPRAADGQPLTLALATLERWSVGDQLLAHRRAGGAVDSFEARVLAIGDLPPGRLARPTLDAASQEVECLMHEIEQLGLNGAPPDRVAIDVTLPGGHRLVGTVLVEAGEEPGPVTVTYSKSSAKRRLPVWLDLLALTVQDPSVEWRAALVTKEGKAPKPKARTEVLRVAGTSAAERHEQALDALEVLVDLYERGRCEPLPLFPNTSFALHEGTAASENWKGRDNNPGEGENRWNQLVFGLELDELCDLPCQPWDPAGRGASRVLRHAHLLWDTVEESLAGTEDEDEEALG